MPTRSFINAKTQSALTRVHKYMTNDHKKQIFFSFVKSQFTYCPLIWMFCTKRSLRKINNIHERCLLFIQQNYISEFERLLGNANEKRFTRNAFSFFWLRFINTWMAYLQILQTLSLRPDKIHITSKISAHLNLRILKQRSLP